MDLVRYCRVPFSLFAVGLLTAACAFPINNDQDARAVEEDPSSTLNTKSFGTMGSAKVDGDNISSASKSPALLSSTPSKAHLTTPRKHHWSDHPLYKFSPDDIIMPILAWYTTRNIADAPNSVSSIGRYTQQAAKLTLIGPDYTDSPEAYKYHNWDILSIGTWGAKNLDNFLDFETTRESSMCIMLGPNYRLDVTDPQVQIPHGFTGIGVAKWNESSPKPKNIDFADFTGEPVSWGYLSCGTLPAGVHKLPSVDRFGDFWGYNLLFGEVDGSIPPLSPMPPGWTGPDIVQHKLCPQELHDMWVVESHDSNDPDVAGMKWQTWHPQKDYVYGCYYGHEHGTPGILAGYTERFHYTAFKNGRQDESHEGFKTHVLPAKDHYLIYNIHANTKDMSRINTVHHTIAVAVTEKESGKLMFEMSCKASSGGSAADYNQKNRPKDGVRDVPMGNRTSQELVEDMYMVPERYYDRKIVKKRINLYNPNNLDPRLRYEGKNEEDHARGVYEAWDMEMLGGICMNASKPYRNAGIEVDIKNTHTGCKDVECEEKIVLGRLPGKYRDYFVPNMGNNRQVRMRGISVGPQYCDYQLPEAGSDGYMKFYTNSYCTEICSGPSSDCVMQKIHKSFTGLTMDGHYEVTDVHGHNTYEFKHAIDDFDDENEVKGLRGIRQVEGALGINVEDH